MRGQDFQEFQELLYKDFHDKTQANGQTKPNKIKDIQQNIPQKAKKMLDQNKGQQNQAYLTSLLFKNLNIDNISVEIEPFDEQFADLMSIIQDRTLGSSVTAKEKIINRKQNIVNSQLNETQQMNGYKNQYLARKETLHQKSYKLFNKLIEVLEQKINQISSTEKEEDKINEKDEQFNKDFQSKNFNCYNKVHDLFVKINNLYSQDKLNMKPQQKMSKKNEYGANNMNQEYQEQYNIEIVDGLIGVNENKIKINNRMDREEQKNERPSEYNIIQIETFYNEVDAQDVNDIYNIFEDFQKKFKDLERFYSEKVANSLSTKKNDISQLFEDVKQRINNFIQQLPFNYFAIKQKEVFDYYQLPSYQDTTISEQQYEQMLKNSHKTIVAYSIKFSLGDLRRLSKDQLINDNLLDCYAQYLTETHRHLKKSQSNQNRSQLDKSEILIFSHLFFETQYESIRIKQGEATTFIENILQLPIKNLFNINCINRFGFIVNVDLHNIKHWIFLAVYNESREIIYLDSASGNNNHFKNLTTALITFFNQVGNVTYTAKKLERCPRQQNGTDCGMFVLKYMQNFAYETSQEFDQEHITQLRQKLYTFFPMLSYQQYHKRVDYETLQYFEGKVVSRCDEFKPELQRKILNI